MRAGRSQRLWDAAAYDSHRNARLRPALDLLTGLLPPSTSTSTTNKNSADAPPPPAAAPPVASLWDLGCGSGSMLPHLRRTFPLASIHAVDSSATMLESARKTMAEEDSDSESKVAFHHADMETFVERFLHLHRGGGAGENVPRPDLIYSNAAFHWMSFPVLRPLLLRLYEECLRPGGILAFQMPDSRTQPSHVHMEELAEEFPSLRRVRVPRNEVDMEEYYRLFAGADNEAGVDASLWTTSYLHPLRVTPDAPLSDGHPVLDFYASTGLGPFLEACTSDEEREEFRSRYNERMRACYPVDDDGRAYLEITRLFCVIRKQGPVE